SAAKPLSLKPRCLFIAILSSVLLPLATAQSADEMAIPVRKNGNDSQPAQVASSDAPASAEKSVARRVTSRLRDDASPSNADEAQAARPRSAASAASSPVVESRLSLYNLDGANAPTGLLRKRTSGGTDAAPPQRRPSAEPAPRQSEPSRQVTSEREEPVRPVRPEG